MGTRLNQPHPPSKFKWSSSKTFEVDKPLRQMISSVMEWPVAMKNNPRVAY